jgi:predicted nuclease of restriction endonuclease-like (RecB) superfamily
MRDFASAWPDPDIVQRLLPNLPWGQNVVLLDKLCDPQTRLWYASQCAKHGWSRNILALQIDARARLNDMRGRNTQ